MATARDLNGSKEHVVAVCGDAAFTCGITVEAMNNVTSCTKRLIVVLNDNKWSIARNVGAVAHCLNRLSTSPTYNKIHQDLGNFFTSLPHGHDLRHLWSKWKRETKDFLVGSNLFENFGLRYLGPIDGHNLEELHQEPRVREAIGVPDSPARPYRQGQRPCRRPELAREVPRPGRL
jgi:1-deoxy-D-xylulose-5-phosphate synthase